MKADVKNKIVLVLGLLTIIFFIASIRFYQDTVEQKKLLNQERRMRMGLEEGVSDLSNQNADLEQEINQLEKMLNQEKVAHQTTQQTLNQEISKLKEELAKVTKLKQKLEENLGEALISQDEPR